MCSPAIPFISPTNPTSKPFNYLKIIKVRHQMFTQAVVAERLEPASVRLPFTRTGTCDARSFNNESF